MRLVLDADVALGELLAVRGRPRLGDDRLDLFLAEDTWEEIQVELPRRIDAFAAKQSLDRHVADELRNACFGTIEANAAIVDRAVCTALEEEARQRSLRDPNRWPLVACCLVVDGAVWTDDHDLLGTGVPTWTTLTLQAWLERNPRAD